MWNYLDFVAANPSVRLGELTSVRFPVLAHEGEFSVTSIGQGLRPPRSHLKQVPRPTVIDAEARIRRYVMERNAGLVEWDPASPGIRNLAPIDARPGVMREWSARLPRAG